MDRHFFVAWLFFSSLQVFVAPENAIEIYSLHVDCKVTSRYAHTVITSRVANRANESKEALFEVELPKSAFITNFSMTIDGKTYPGIIKEKKSAQDQYDAAVSQGQSAGLVKSTGRKLEQFRVSVNVAAAAKVNFELTYEELLKRKLGKYELLIKVKPKQLVKHFQIDTHIFEPQGISALETESTFITNELNNALTKVQNETKAHISFKPTIDQQRKTPGLDDTLLDGDFLIRYDVKRSETAGDIQIVNGYFVHYFAPSQMPAFPKNVVFVIDTSGSMSGKKIWQTKEAMKKILEDLNPEDYFSLVLFNGTVRLWTSSLLQATEDNVERAKRHVFGANAHQATDINGALQKAIQSLDKDTKAELLPDQSISMIILLTDGQPTTGETNIDRIQRNIREANEGKYFLYCLGFGFDVSYTFLEKMALENGGVARRIYEDSDAALQLQGFYHEVATPILKEIEMKYPDNTVLEITQNNFKLLFDGSEIVVAGKLGNDVDDLPVEIKAKGHASELTLKEEANIREKEQVFQHQKYIFGNFIERLWAYLTIQQLLEKSASADGEQQETLEAQVLNISLKFGFVTPLTSMVVTKPDAQEVANKPTEADNENINTVAAGTSGMKKSSRIVGGSNPHDNSRRYPFSFPSRSRIAGGKSFFGDFWNYPFDSRGRPSRRYYDHPQTGFFITAAQGNAPSHSSIMCYYADYSYTLPGGHPGNVQSLPDAVNEYPSFILQLTHEKNPICLNINGQLQTPITLLTDTEKGIQVTGKLGENRKFVEFNVIYQTPNVQINVSMGEIILNDQGNVNSFPWTKNASLTTRGLSFLIEKERRLSLSGADGITIQVYYMKNPLNFLGLHFKNSELFSNNIVGLFGQFYSNKRLQRHSNRKKTLTVQGQSYSFTRQNKKDYRIEQGANVNFTCWSLDITP
ncbi:inter-alpha-trypsin inhibitor heavy chain H4-like isoform X1 [Podarcis lilfordi]|uniref:Inter-alpha-trypsin inhibitor heavy chain H4-like isoform X1 n=1 Tax=Podarcis lilfordi TaxID=74358 RepID=A0AA35JXX7_9SAUR|nr:inter-alpha-trypsin inhibitor heavy chain H4-like isoform X1 [Podarcis lilfordi]